MLNFMDDKKMGSSGPQPHILFNGNPRVGTPPQEAEIRANAAFSKYCMNTTLKKYSAFSEPEGGTGFVWSSKKPYSTEALRNLLAVGAELLSRIGS